jgi:hypothetical protein
MMSNLEYMPPAPANSATATSDEIARMNEQMDVLARNVSTWRTNALELERKIDNVRGHIMDLYSMNGEIDDDIKMIAEFLDIELTKRISGTAVFEINFSADVPLDFDADDFELSFDVSCDTYEADNFEWDEDNTEINAMEED